MNTHDLQGKLEERLKAELQAYEQAGVPERIYLPKTLLYSALRKQTEISRRISALKTAIEFLSKPLREVDVHGAVLMSISDKHSEKEEWLSKAESIYLNERKEALRIVFEKALPCFKKQMLKYL